VFCHASIIEIQNRRRECDCMKHRTTSSMFSCTASTRGGLIELGSGHPPQY